ncbi:glycosyltransferase involved in cell wall biosynthesis [Salinibacter ruber]|uniref:glycosyltransferase family 2 protein n=1 Tax=Salinibacter ruber TaxID=146919 RepID=UPI002168F997|nr:glycosyltransferase involved in cell wall biosynthesis [Salinibacter ruber]
MPFFSILIPVYNRGNLIRETLDSVLAQEYEDYEVIVVDDGSTDETVSVLREYGDRITLLQQENKGPGAARNAGLKAATGEYTVFLDSDDRWFPWTLSCYREAIETYDRPSLLSAPVCYFASADEVDSVDDTHDTSSIRGTYFTDFLEAAGQGIYVSSNSSAVRRSALEDIGGFTSANINAEDHDLALRLGMKPGFVRVESPPMVAVRRHEDQVTTQIDKTWRGITYLLNQEEEGQYPGGSDRQRERRYILCQHARSFSADFLKEGNYHQAWALYQRTFRWQLQFLRMKYLVGFPLLALWSRSGLTKSS